MGIIIKYIVRNLWEKKLRTLLILFSIILSVALFFASSAIGGTFAQMYINRMKVYFGGTDLMIEPQPQSPSPWVSTGWLDGEENIDFTMGLFYGSGTYRHERTENIHFTMMGINWEDLQNMNPVTLISPQKFGSFTGMSIILGDAFCNEYGFRVGEYINLEVNGSLRKFYVAGIATGGVFIEDGINPARNTFHAVWRTRGV